MNTIFANLFDEKKEIEKEIYQLNKKIDKLQEKNKCLAYSCQIARLMDFFAEYNFNTIVNCQYEQEIHNRITIGYYSINIGNKKLVAKKSAPFVIYGNPSWEEQEIIENYDFLKSFERDEKTIEYFGYDFLENLSFDKLMYELKNNIGNNNFDELVEYGKKLKSYKKKTKDVCVQC